MLPRSGRTKPQIALNSVVLPAPLGPMIPWISLAAMRSETPSRARIPPKCTVRSATSSVVCCGSDTPRLPNERSIRLCRGRRGVSSRPQETFTPPAAQQGRGGGRVGAGGSFPILDVSRLEPLDQAVSHVEDRHGGQFGVGDLEESLPVAGLNDRRHSIAVLAAQGVDPSPQIRRQAAPLPDVDQDLALPPKAEQDVLTNHVLDRFDRPSLGPEKRHDSRIEVLLHAEADGEENVLFAGEVMVERRRSHRQLGGQIPNARGIVATLGEQAGSNL